MLVFKKSLGFRYRKIFISLFLVSFTIFAFASIGGDKAKSKKNSLQSGFTPIRTTKGFTMKDGANYRGSLVFKQDKTSQFVSFNSIVTYQKGNATYILPNKYKISLNSGKSDIRSSSLQLLQLKIKICK